MSDFVTRAKALNVTISKANSASEESRTRLKVRKEQFITMLEEFGTVEGIDLVSEYKAGGLEKIEEVLRKLHEDASEKLEAEIEMSQKIISAYGNQDFGLIDVLLGKPAKTKGVKAKAPVKAVESPKPVEEDAPVVAEADVEADDSEEVVTEPSSDSNDIFAQILGKSAGKAESEESDSDSDVGVSVVDAVNRVDASDEEEYMQTTQPSLGNFLKGAKTPAPKAEPKAEPATAKKSSLFTDDDDEPVAPTKSNKSIFTDDDEEETGDVFGDISLSQIMGTNVNTGGNGF